MIPTRKTLPFLLLVLASGAFAAQADTKMPSQLESLRTRIGLTQEHAMKAQALHMDGDIPVHHLQQFYRGVKVWGGLSNVREEGGELKVATQKLFHDIDLVLEPSLSTTELRKTVDLDLERPARPQVHLCEGMADDREALNPENPAQTRYLSEPELELVIFPVEEQGIRPGAAHKSLDELNAEDVEYVVTGYRLAYHVATDAVLAGRRELMNYLVDAHSGEIIKKWNGVMRAAVAGTANTKYSGTVTLYTHQNGSNYEAKDPVYCNNYVTNSETSSTPYSDVDNIWGNGGNWGDNTAIARQTGAGEALYALQRSCQMLKAVWGRNGSSGTGIPMKVVWSQVLAMSTAVYPEQNYIVAGFADPFYNDMTKLDILGHEYGHSFDFYTAKLCRAPDGEGKGMAEAHGDIMGLLTEVYGKYTPNDPNNPASTIPEAGLSDPKTWITGEDAVKSAINGGKGLRFFIKPSWDVYEKAIDAWKYNMASVECHAGAGPVDRMFYYLAVGAPSSSTHDGYTSYLPSGSKGVGLHKAAHIWVKTMLSGQLSSSSKHIDARNACISTATTLHGANSAEVAAVQNAWAGVNVGLPAPVVSVAITPSATTMLPNVYQLFKATVTNTGNTAVTWTCTGGYVNNTGNFKAPTVSSSKTYKVRATSVADTSKYAEATVTVNPSVVSTYNEVESNGSLSAANVVPDTSTKITGTMSANTDLDFFKLSVAPGRTLSVNMTGPTGADFDLFLLNSAGTVLKRSESSTCTESVSYQNSGNSTATYYIKVTRDSGSSSSNIYNLSLLR